MLFVLFLFFLYRSLGKAEGDYSVAREKHQLALSLRDQHVLNMNRAMRKRNKAKKNGKAEKKWDEEAKKCWSLSKEAEPPLVEAEKDMFAAYRVLDRVAGPLKDMAAAARLELNMLLVKECICIIKFVCLQVGPSQASTDLHISHPSILKWRKEGHEVKASAILQVKTKKGNPTAVKDFMQRVKKGFTTSVHCT
jgi:hypothetical protein